MNVRKAKTDLISELKFGVQKNNMCQLEFVHKIKCSTDLAVPTHFYAFLTFLLKLCTCFRSKFTLCVPSEFVPSL